MEKKLYRVIHFVWGGNSGSTKIARSIVCGHLKGAVFEPLLVLRSPKKIDQELLDYLTSNQIPFRIVPKEPRFRMIGELIKIIRDFKPHALVAHGYREHIYGRLAALIAKVSVIIQVEHNTDIYKVNHYLQSQFLSLFTKKIICVSHGVKNHLTKMGFNRNKMQVIYNGIDLDKFHADTKTSFKDRDANIIMAARFSKQKDHKTLIKAMKILHDNHKDCQLILAGGGKHDIRVKMENLCNRLKLQDNIHFLGVRNDIPDLMRNNQISVLSTHYEGLGIVILEAMACGCVVLASKISPIDEIIEDGKTGYLIPPKDHKAWAEKIQFLLENTDIAAQIARQGQEYARKNFSMERMNTQYEDLLLRELNQVEIKITGDSQ